MPIFHDIPLDLDISRVLRWQGCKGRESLHPQISARAQSLLAGLNTQDLLQPAVAFEQYPADDICRTLCVTELSHARSIAAVVCTIGPCLEKASAGLFQKGEPLKGLLLDSIGNAAIDLLSEKACDMVRNEAFSQGWRTASPVNPGAHGLPLSAQQTLFGLSKAHRIGVSLAASGALWPRKSVSMAIAMGPDIPERTGTKACDDCNMAGTCRYRQNTFARSQSVPSRERSRIH